MANERRTSRRRAQSGFSVVETLIGTVVLAIALLGHVASTVAEDAMARDGQVRSEVLHTVRQFVERLRADDGWADLYANLRKAQLRALQPTLTGEAAKGATKLDDGTWALDPRFYYPDFVLPDRVRSLRVLVEAPAGVDGLREDQVAAEFGLPADLNGDGAIDDQPHQTDYRVLPVRVRFMWSADALGTRSMQLTTWLGVTR